MSGKFIKTLVLCFALFSCIVVMFLHIKKSSKKIIIKNEYKANSIAQDEVERAKWEFNRLKDPATGKIPAGISRYELEYAKTLPTDIGFNLKSVKWVSRGPYNVGGRTRALALDINDENRILAGGVSGGIWLSTDMGKTWEKQSLPAQLQSVSCITQDTRPGKTNNWYYGSGEFLGNSASAEGAPYLGNGIYKSTDNGLTWQSLPATASNTPYNFETLWDMIWNVKIDPSNLTSDVVYAATVGSIYVSSNGGTSWKSVLGGINSISYYTDVEVSKTGVAYAILSNERSTLKYGGIYRSVDGYTWTKITPDSFPPLYKRIVIAINPSNENEVYFYGQCLEKGVLTHTFLQRTERLTLWKYKYLSGDGSGSNGEWTDLSSNLPIYSNKVFNNLYSQGGYDLTIKVKPNEPNTIFIGGTNLYRSTNGFTTPDNSVQIGGYEIGTEFPDFHLYKNHHPDQHDLVFLPSNPDIMISANDGGLHKTNNNQANIVEWERLNNGYQTTQPFTISIDEETTSNSLLVGFQDNGNFFTNSSDPQANWVMPLNGDGSFGSIIKGGETYYISIQEGKTYKMTLDNEGNRTAFTRMDPIGGKGYEFINQFVVDPNNKNLMYMAGGRKLWRNDSLTYIPMNNTFDSISKGWYVFPDTLTKPDSIITAMAVSKKNPSNIVYYGTNQKNVYRIDSANTSKFKRTLITGKYFPVSFGGTGGNVSCIAVDPEDGKKVFVVFSNYNVYSLFYSKDAGVSWLRVGGNLEPKVDANGNSKGPSCRWVNIMTFPNNKRIYFLGTSVGLFATDTLIDETYTTKTIWTSIGADVIGNVIVGMVKTRPTDNLVAVATHGNGVYTTHVNSYQELVSIFERNRNNNATLQLFPNPSSSFAKIYIELTKNEEGDVYIYNNSGKLIKQFSSYTFGHSKEALKINISDLSNGVYYCVVNFKDRKLSKQFVVLK